MPKKQNLLLIGCGDLPKRLVSKLNLDIWQVTGLCRSQVDFDSVQMHFGDANDAKIIESLLQKAPDQLIITLAPDTRTAEAYRETYLRPAQLIAETARELAPSCHLIFISSTSVYGQNDGESVDEHSNTDPAEETGQILVQAEKAIIYSGNPWSIVRFSGIYGPGRDRLLKKVAKADFTERANWTNRIHSDDCAGLLAYLIQHPEFSRRGAGVLIGTDNKPVVNIEVERWLAEQLGINTDKKYLAKTRIKGKRCDNSKLLEYGYILRYPSYRNGYRELISTS